MFFLKLFLGSLRTWFPCTSGSVRRNQATDKHEENMLSCASTKITKFMRKKVKMGRLLIKASCRPWPIPYEVRVILEEKLNSETRFASIKVFRKSSIARLDALAKRIQTLAQLSWAAIIGHIRVINGNRTTFSITKELGPPNFLTANASRFLNYNYNV